MIQAGIARLLQLFPDRRFNPLERDEYNRRIEQLFEWVRDFIILHYKATRRQDSEFWKQCAAMSIPASLEQKIEQFRNKGRVFAEGLELFNSTSWVSVMLGQQIIPEGYDPTVDGLDEDRVAAALEQLRAAYLDTAERLPSMAEFIARYCAAPSQPPAREFAL
jgi:tryptophan 7-halogenase